MARKKHTRKKSGGSSAQSGRGNTPTRRGFLRRSALWALGGTATVVAGGAFAYDFARKMDEADLTRIGQGTPAIVQIHDPQCTLCRALQKQTRRALRSFDGDALTYLVANIRSDDGAAFANRVGAPHVTLVLFDGAGREVHRIQGVTPADTLRDAFARYLRLRTTG